MEEIHDKKPCSTNKRRIRAKLIFNPGSGVKSTFHATQHWSLVLSIRISSYASNTSQ